MILLSKTDIGLFFNFIFVSLFILTIYGFTKSKLTEQYTKEFKNKIIAPLIHFIEPTLIYKKDKYIDKETFILSKIETEPISNYLGSDFVYGTIDGVNIKFSQLNVSVKKADDSSLVLWGLFIVAEFPKHFQAHTIVYSKNGRPLGKGAPAKEYKKITMDSPLFNDAFIVYSTDEVEARYIFSHTLMERVLEYNQKIEYPLVLSFIDGNIYIAYNGGEILTPTLQRSLFKLEVASSYSDILHFAISVVGSLRLDLKLWSKY